MKRANGICALVAGAAFLLGSAVAQAQTPVRLSLNTDWKGPAAPFAVALDRGYFNAEGLDAAIQPAASSRDAIARVASGEADAAVADVNALVRFRDQNPEAEVKAVMMIQDRTPAAIVGRKSRGITKDLASLKGKTLGAPAVDDTFGLWPVLKAINGINDEGTKFEDVGIPVREPLLAQGEVDAVFGSAITSYIDLASRGVPTEDIVVLPVNDYGLDAYGNAIVVSEKFAKENPEAVKGLLRAVTKGVQETVKDPEGTVEAVLKRNDLAKRDVELHRLKTSLEQTVITPWVKEHGFGGIDRERFAKVLDQIGKTLEDGKKPQVEEVFTDEFLPAPDQRKVAGS